MVTKPTTAPTRPSYQAARRQRAQLLRAIQDFEHAIASPSGEPGWRERVQRHLAALRERLTAHVMVTEGPDGLYTELLEHAPRLARPVAGLIAEHGDLVARTDTLAHRLRTAEYSPPVARDAAGDLLAALSRHRQRGADLVYEAYATDIGGET